jgi:hypothetical protein
MYPCTLRKNHFGCHRRIGWRDVKGKDLGSNSGEDDGGCPQAITVEIMRSGQGSQILDTVSRCRGGRKGEVKGELQNSGRNGIVVC